MEAEAEEGEDVERQLSRTAPRINMKVQMLFLDDEMAGCFTMRAGGEGGLVAARQLGSGVWDKRAARGMSGAYWPGGGYESMLVAQDSSQWPCVLANAAGVGIRVWGTREGGESLSLKQPSDQAGGECSVIECRP